MESIGSINQQTLASYIQHTQIAVGTTRDQAITHARECVTHGFNAAMVAGSWVAETAAVLRGTDIKVASALDFPTVGVMTSAGKAAEAAELVRLGAQELDIGVQVGWLKSGDYAAFRNDIVGVVAAGVPVKVMLELPLLTPPEREAAIELAVDAGATYLKNASSGQIEVANPESIRFLVDRAPDNVLVKASGGIKSRRQVLALIDAGAALVGSSSGVEIVTSGEASDSY